jgi:hypothetical protein
MKCSKCESTMEEVRCHDIVIDRCHGCHGLWFDIGEAKAMSEEWIAALIDIGDAAVGEQHDLIDTIGCLRCGLEMRRFLDIEGAMLQYEQRDQHGKFFDAGEFTLWAESQYL